jgi:hypothetical protein
MGASLWRLDIDYAKLLDDFPARNSLESSASSILKGHLTMATSTSARPPMPKPRKAQIILESTTALIAVTLIIWLLFWFVKYKPATQQILAFHLQGEPTAFHLEADRAALQANLDGKDSIEPSTEDVMTQKIVTESETHGRPLVVSIAAPRGIKGADFDLKKLLQKLVAVANRDVLIVLDQAQIDSDRELGIFGNAPYLDYLDNQDLAKDLQDLKPRHNLFVLLSCEPGQKSWMIDGIGRSAFSYFVQKGLEGIPRTGGSTEKLNVDQFTRLVRQSTSEWVERNRSRAIQTPKLLSIGQSVAKNVQLPTFSLPKNVITSEPKSDPAATVAAKDAPQTLQSDLIKEWESYEKLPKERWHRYAPVRLRHYESLLLKAERLVRASWNDRFLRDNARSALDSARNDRVRVVELLETELSEKDFPFRPLDENGTTTLNDSLKDLTGLGLDGSPPLPSDKPDNGPLKKLLRKPEGIPDPFLELQLPAWAYQFNQAFGVDHFKDSTRGGLLRQIVSQRKTVEAALAVDRRGLSWIKETVEDGDKSRRMVQDSLFAVSISSDDDRTRTLVTEFGVVYDKAAQRINDFHRARTLFEKIAAELPYYEDWVVLVDASKASPLSGRIEEIEKTTRSLANTLEKPMPEGEFKATIDDAEGSWKVLADDFTSHLTSLRSSPDWRGLDDILTLPLIPVEQRKPLLDKILEKETKLPEIASIPIKSEGDDDTRVDLGFVRKARGLALVDGKLSRLGVENGTDNPTDTLPERGDKTSLAEALQNFRKVTQRTQLERQRMNSTGLDDKKWSEEDFLKVALRADRNVRFRSVSDSSGDQAAIQLESYGRAATLHFQAQRLEKDFASDVESLDEKASKLAKIEFSPRVKNPQGHLVVAVEPSTIPIHQEDHSADFKVKIKWDVWASNQSLNSIDGSAFVGVRKLETSGDEPKNKQAQLLLNLESNSRSPSRPGLVGRLFDIRKNMEKEGQSIDFHVEQNTDLEENENPTKNLAAKVFFRGRVENDGIGLKKVAVECVKFGEPLEITISQDLRGLKEKYDAKYASEITDQIEEHPTAGYLHCGGKLDYLVTVRNKTKKSMDIVVERTLIRAGMPLTIGKEELTLAGTKSELIPGTLDSTDVPKDQKTSFRVQVTDKASGKIFKKEISMTQYKSIKDYISINPRQEEAEIKGVLKPNCLVLHVTRRQDFVSLPISLSDIVAYEIVDGKQNLVSKSDKAVLGILGRKIDQTILVKYEILPGTREIKWKLVVEEGEESGTYVINNR